MNTKSKTISLGDKIFARVTRNGQTIYNFVSETVVNMTDLINQLRRAMKDVQGLVMIHIRNYHQGWGDQRPLMLYARKENQFQRMVATEVTETPKELRHAMFFPWETH